MTIKKIKTTKSRGSKDSCFDRKVHIRVLHLLNNARAPEDIMTLRPNFFAEIQSPGREPALVHDRELNDKPSVTLFDRKTAELILCERDKISPLHGFSHFDQIVHFLDAKILELIIDILIRYFGGIGHGEWKTTGDVAIGRQTMIPRHAALLHTGEVLMIEGACVGLVSRTWLWSPYTQKMVTAAPRPPGNNLYCSGHSFLTDGRLLAFGGGGEYGTPGPKNAGWIFDSLTRGWTDNIAIADQSSKATPAMAMFDGKLHMVHLGNSSNNIWHTTYDEDTSTWTPNVKISSQSSKASPSLAVFDGKLHMVHLGNSSNNIWHTTHEAGSALGDWAPNIKISDQSSKAPPSLAVFDGKLHMVHLGNTSNNIWHTTYEAGSPLGEWAPNAKIPDQTSKAPPSLAVFDGKLQMVHLGNSSNNIWHTTYEAGSALADWAPNAKIPGQTSKAPPSLAEFDGKLHMVHLGNTSNNIWHTNFEADSPLGDWVPNVKIPGQTSKVSPSLAVFNGRLHMLHLGNTSNKIWHSQFARGLWDVTRDMNTNKRTWGKEHRWYPTLATLGDNRVLVTSGHKGQLGCGESSTPEAIKMEIYNESTGNFDHVSTPADKFFRPTYPGLHLLPNNQVFFAPVGFRNYTELPGACAGNESSSLLSLNGLDGNWDDVGEKDRTKGMSALLLSNSPPYVRVMVVGGGDSGASRTYTFADLSSPTPEWGDDLQLPIYGTETQPTQRIHPNVVLLPDGTVFVAGGASVTAPCLMYDSDSANPGWSQMDELAFERRYHSYALLLPTAEVMASGGSNGVGRSTIEVFRPPYLFKGPQPTISAVSPDPVPHGQNFTIITPNASSIARVTLVRPMAVTHQTDSEQRVIELRCAPGRAANTITATAPDPRHPHGLAPRGWYMLFIIDNTGVPSQAKFIRLHY